MICYFYDTGMRFVKILHQEENINLTRARMLFGFILTVLIIGKWDYYINEMLIQVNRVLLKNDICGIISNLSGVMVYFHNFMPIMVGCFILYIVYFMASASKRNMDLNG